MQNTARVSWDLGLAMNVVCQITSARVCEGNCYTYKYVFY